MICLHCILPFLQNKSNYNSFVLFNRSVIQHIHVTYIHHPYINVFVENTKYCAIYCFISHILHRLQHFSYRSCYICAIQQPQIEKETPLPVQIKVDCVLHEDRKRQQWQDHGNKKQVFPSTAHAKSGAFVYQKEFIITQYIHYIAMTWQQRVWIHPSTSLLTPLFQSSVVFFFVVLSS